MRTRYVWRLLVAALAVMGVMAFGTGQAFAATAGDPTLTVPIDDSESGASYDQQFSLAYSDQTPDGTPVYVYVPEGAFAGVAGVDSLDPAFDPTRRMSSCPAPTMPPATM
jgi:hypothetical protein